MTLLYRRIAQVPNDLLLYISALRDGGFYSFDNATNLNRKVIDLVSRLERGESVEIRLANTHFADETVHATLIATMNPNGQITWRLELPT